MCPLARYHALELSAIADELERMGRTVEMIVPEADRGQIVPGLGGRSHHVWKPETIPTIMRGAEGFVALNDWGPSRAIYEWCAANGVPTFAKVEGVQDFDDVDTPFVRRPYRTADHVLAQGQNDVRALDRPSVHIVGNAHLEELWQARSSIKPVTPTLAIINSNFTYGVLTEHRDDFLRAAISSAEAAGIAVQISRHPADTLLPEDLRTRLASPPLSELLDGPVVLVTRFSTVIYEAMARRRPVVYFNPHRERVVTFADPDGAFASAGDASTLTSTLKDILAGWRPSDHAVERFFGAQVDRETMSSARRAANVIHELSRAG